ncbi:MAG TPA: hypothetical protein VML96_00935, partial [Egibacteraceae bacterium]|nr:hypothetical protein [Egibacteraceae bacterium]
MSRADWEAPAAPRRGWRLWFAVAASVALIAAASSMLSSEPAASPPTALDVQVDVPAADSVGAPSGWPPEIDVEVLRSRGPLRPAGAPEWAVRTDQAPASTLAGAWAPLPEAPIEPRLGSTAVWAGPELLTWGGTSWAAYSDRREFFADGAAYDPAAEAWRRMADAPLSPRRGASAVWTGEVMIIWGGVGADSFHADGAAYDPVVDQWRPLAPAPLAPRAGSAAAWTGEEMIVLGGHDNAGPLSDGASYDPASDSWTVIAPGPLGIGRSWSPGAVRAGESVAVWADSWGPGGMSGALYDPRTDSWRLLPEDGLGDEFVQQILWDGAQLLALTAEGAPGNLRVRSLAPDAAAWTPLPDIPSAQSSEPLALTAGRALLVLAGPG